MELEKHIEILLLDNDCVIIPGLGGFIAYHTDARYDSETSVFIPPTRVAGFNPKLSMNDNLIAQSYVESYDISYPEAVKRISCEADKLKAELEHTGSYEIPGVGTLKINEKGAYDFEPFEAGLLTPELYGLNCFEVAGIKSASEKANSPKEEVKAEEKSSTKFVRIKVSTIRNVAAAAVALFAFLLLSSPLSNGDKNIASIGSLQNSVFNKMIPAGPETSANNSDKSAIAASRLESEAETAQEAIKQDTIIPAGKAAEQVSATTGKTVEEKAEAKTIAAATPKAEKYYCIVLASALSEYNAGQYVKKLTNEGYKNISSIDCSNGMKVVYGKFVTNKEANESLATLRSDSHFAEAWIYKVTEKK